MRHVIDRLRTKSIVRWIHRPGDTPEMRGHKPDPDCQKAAAALERVLQIDYTRVQEIAAARGLGYNEFAAALRDYLEAQP